MAEETLYCVYESFSGETPALMGRLYAGSLRGKECCAFAWEEAWLRTHADLPPLDPDLQPFPGRQYPPAERAVFGALADSAPDRWGRRLLRSREAVQAAREGRPPRLLRETDFLLGVQDGTRMGALRFAAGPEGPFLAGEEEGEAAPPWRTLSALEEACLAREAAEERGEEDGRALRLLLAPGAALGGARPKASVRAADGSLWVAKFPSRKDGQDTGAWEMVAHELAAACGLRVPEARLERLSGAGSTFLVRRFDREGRRRIHFASAMALLGKTDGASGQDGSSYLDLAEFLMNGGAAPEEDLPELWRRMVFSMAIANVDDHLRNHGFLLTPRGWRLSPAYDLNPVPFGDRLSLNVTLDEARLDPALALETASFYGLAPGEAERQLQGILEIVRGQWRPLADRFGISRKEQEAMAPAFTRCGS